MQNLNYQNVLGMRASDEWLTTVLRVTLLRYIMVLTKSSKAEELTNNNMKQLLF